MSPKYGTVPGKEASLTYMVRIAHVLHDRDRLGISNLALLSRINHKRLSQNLRWLEQQGYVKIVTNTNNRKEVCVTEVGNGYIRQLVSLRFPGIMPEFAA